MFKAKIVLGLLWLTIMFSVSQYSYGADSEAINRASSEYRTVLMNMQDALMRDPRAAQTKLQSMDHAVIQSDKELELLWLLRLAESCNQAYQYDRFEEYVTAALDLVKPSHSKHLQALTLFYHSILLRRKGDFGQAAIIAKKAIQMAKEIPDTYIQVVALVDLAFTYSQDEQFESSLLILQQGFVIANAENNPLLLAQVHEMYGALYSYLDKPEESIKNYLKSQRLYEQLGYPYYIAENAFGMATTYRDWQKWDEAIEGFELYHQAVTPIDSEYTRFFYGYGLGQTYALKGDCQLAMAAIDPVLKMEAFQDYRAELLKKKAICLARVGQFTLAELAIEDARKIFASMPDLKGTSWEIETNKIAAQVAAMKGEHAIAYETLQKYYDDLQLIQKTNTSRRLEKLKLELEQEREKLEVVVLERQSQEQQMAMNIQERQIEIQRIWLYGSISFILVILSFAGWQFRTSRKLKSLSITDELTGLSNRRYIFSAIERILAHKSDSPFHHSLLLIDVDNLKPINDQYGHLDGDKVLKTLAEVGRSISREGDIFARTGGDEFMLLLTRTDNNLEFNIANRLINSLAEATVITESGAQLLVTVSIGITSIDEKMTSLERLLTEVDEALYRAKSAGRNCYSR